MLTSWHRIGCDHRVSCESHAQQTQRSSLPYGHITAVTCLADWLQVSDLPNLAIKRFQRPPFNMPTVRITKLILQSRIAIHSIQPWPNHLWHSLIRAHIQTLTNGCYRTVVQMLCPGGSFCWTESVHRHPLQSADLSEENQEQNPVNGAQKTVSFTLCPTESVEQFRPTWYSFEPNRYVRTPSHRENSSEFKRHTKFANPLKRRFVCYLVEPPNDFWSMRKIAFY